MNRAIVTSAMLSLAACATLGGEGAGDVGLPSSGAGPFRDLAGQEVPGEAPFVLASVGANFREPAALLLGENLGAPSVLLFTVASVSTNGVTADAIVETHADDGRAFYGTLANTGNSPSVAITPTEPFEEGGVSGPALLQDSGGAIYVYYATNAGIARATFSIAGEGSAGAITNKMLVFPVSVANLANLPGAPRAPSIAKLQSGIYDLMFAAGSAIYEATSTDGVTFALADADVTTRVIDPILAPSAPVNLTALAVGEKPPFDTGSVSDPCVFPRITAANREQVRVLYTGTDLNGVTSIGFAARYGESGPLTRQPLAVYAVDKGENAPAVIEWSQGALLYVSETPASTSSVGPKSGASIAGAYSPADLTLPNALPFPADP